MTHATTSARYGTACAWWRVALAMVAWALLARDSSAWGQAVKSRPRAAAALAAGQLDPAVLKAVKAATVQLRVTLPNGSLAQGSGFFGVEPGVVLTNAHVLGLFRSDSRRPQKIEVVIRSGERDERRVPARVLGVDTKSDLAVLRVSGTNLPEPLTVSSAADLLETQPVYIFGFPFGTALGKAITVSGSSVSSLRRNNAGVLQRVQVNGGMNPGNSGGPVVDTEGRVVGVAVSAVSRTQINFAVPGDLVHAMMAGRVNEVTLGHPYRDRSDVKTPIELRLLDPLGRVKKASLVCWAGKNAKTRAEHPPEPPAGDPKRRALELPIAQGNAKGEFVLPPVADGEVYWLQPVVTDGAGHTTKWEPLNWPAKVPVERTPAVLALKLRPKTKNDLDLTSNSTLAIRGPDGNELSLVSTMRVAIVENVTNVSDQGIADIRLNYTKITLGLKINNETPPKDQRTRSMIKDMFKMTADLRVDPKGALISNQMDVSKVPPASRKVVASLGERIQESIQAVELTLPGKMTAVGEPWTMQREFAVETSGDDEKAIMNVTCTYLGRHVRNKINEALIDMKGEVRGRSGNGRNAGGRVQGLAYVDLDNGRIHQANVTTYIDMDINLGGQSGKLNGKLEVRLARKPAADARPAQAAK